MGTCGQVTSSLLCLNRHRGTNPGQPLVLMRYLHRLDSTLGHQTGHATTANDPSPLQLAVLCPRVPNRYLAVRI